VQGGDPGALLGTDGAGRDLLSAIMYALGVSLLIGIGALAIQAVLGGAIGIVAGYRGGTADGFLMRLAEIQDTFSTPLIAIAAVAVLSASGHQSVEGEAAFVTLIVMIGLAGWPRHARMVRAGLRAEAGKAYLETAKAIGLPAVTILRRHLLPGLGRPFLAVSALQLAEAILTAAALAFLGFGLRGELPALGCLIREGLAGLPSGAWGGVLFPGLALGLLVLSLKLLGDWLLAGVPATVRRGE